MKLVTGGYHQTLAIPLSSGRYFDDSDRQGTEAVVILSDAAARLYYGNTDPSIVLSTCSDRVTVASSASSATRGRPVSK